MLEFYNLVSRAFSSIKKAVGETLGQGCWNTPRIVECFVTWHIHDEMAFSEVVSSVWQPWLFSTIRSCCSNKTKTFHRVCGRNSNELLEPLWRPWPGVSSIAILNEEKALGTRLRILIKQTPETRTTFRKLVELDLFVLSFIQNNDLLKYYTINFKNIVKAQIAKKYKKIRFQFSLS